MKCQTFAFTLTLLVASLAPQVVHAQVFGSGPSDPALFNTVINLPPEPNIGNNESIGSGIQLNLSLIHI